MNIVVVGGGFGGIKAALELSRRKVGKITLISDEPYFLHHATLYSTATGKSYAESVIPLQTIFANHPDVHIVTDTVLTIDDSRRIAVGRVGQYQYDELVLSLGSVTTFFNIPGMQEKAFGIKTLDEVKVFQNHIIDEIVEKKLDREYFIIGGGQTGVELAGSLNEYLKSIAKAYRIKNAHSKVVIVEAGDRLLPRMSKTASRKVHRALEKQGVKILLNRKVESLDDDSLTISGRKYPTTTAIWTSGVANNPFYKANGDLFDLAPNGRVYVNQYLQANQHIYVIGDNNTIKHSGMAWPALKQATHVAKTIARTKDGRQPKPFRSHSVPSGVPIGERWGYVEWHGVYVAGRCGYRIRRYMELYGYKQLVGLKAAIPVWRTHFVPEVDP